MKILSRNFIYLFKNSYRSIGLFFWNLIFPIILVTFFYIGFSGIINNQFNAINVGIEKGNPFTEIFQSIDNFNIKEIPTEDININLEEKSIDGFIDMDLNLYVSDSGINQSIIKEIIEQIKQMVYLNRPMENYDFDIDYIEGKSQNANGVLVIFYALIAMVSTYGVHTSIEIISLAQANLSNIGARLNVGPLKKRSFLFSGILVAFLLNFFSNMLLLLFIKFVLGMDLFIEVKHSILFITLGNLFGVSLGIFIGASNTKSLESKTMLATISTIFLAFLSGMMSTDVKTIIDERIPILSKINPISIISNNLYRINYLENTKDVSWSILTLFLYSVVLIFISFVFLRRRDYDSI